MKKILLSLLAICLAAISVSAQHCAAATTNITPRTYAQPGLHPLSDSLPCTVQGIQVYDTIYFQNFTTVQGQTVQSLKIDSINNLPPGLCWVTNQANNTFAGGQAGVILLQGVPTGPPGQYKLRIIVDVNIGFNIPNLNAESATGLRYWVRTKCATATCTPIDTNSPYPTYIPYTACGGPPIAAISPAGNVNLCSGSSLSLTATSGTGYTYKWSTGATTQMITVTTAGSYVVTVHNTTDSAVSAPTTVTLVSLPSAVVTPAGPDSICSGDSVLLTATASGLTYHWTGGATTQALHVTTGGAYSVTVTNSNNCTAVSTPVTVVVKSPPTATITRAGFVLTASAGTAYQWYKNGSLLTGQTAQTLTVTANGSYTVAVTGANGCSARSAATSVVNVGINDINENAAIRLYPNPSEGLLTLETSGRNGDSYDIYDALGRTVQQKTISADKMLIDMSSQTPGIYYLTIKHNSANETIRFSLVK